MSARTGDAKDGVPGFISSGSTPVVAGDILKPVRRAPEQSASEGHPEGHRGTLGDTVRGTLQSAQSGRLSLSILELGMAASVEVVPG
jgi:hypothetical protein